MPDKWTAEQHERLLFVLIDQYKLPTKDIAAGWKKKYPNDKNPPTAGALDQHITKARKANGGGKAPTKTMTALLANSLTTTHNGSVAATPRKPAASKTPRTPAGGNKRKRATMSEDEMSDANDTEPELSKATLANIGRRTSTPRSQKSAGKNYKEDSTDDENDEDDEDETRVEDGAADSEVAGSSGANDDFNEFLNFDGTAEKEPNHLTGAMPSKKRHVMQDESDAQSDDSNFSADIK